MGGRLYDASEGNKEDNVGGDMIDVETFFRPSTLEVLNDRDYKTGFFEGYFGEDRSGNELPSYLLRTPENCILNYFSILREAANPQEGKLTGCGTIGNATLPYPVAYRFLSSEYKNKISYQEYLNTFKNVLHINLIKLREVPVYEAALNSIRYFIEVETIEGSEKPIGYFAYYYGYVDIQEEGSIFRISSLEFYGENYLCAPYHGWDYDAEGVVDIKYGEWCSLVQERYPTQQEGYVKKVPFKGTDGNDYLIEFYQLTNDTDVEIAQYRKAEDGKWTLIQLDPNKCLDQRN